MKLIQFEGLFIRDFTASVWPFPLHNHNHYELMFIQEGSGIHILNGTETQYHPSYIFFLLPEDTHDFIIAEKTHFRVIKFLPNVLKEGINNSSADFWDHLLFSLTRKLQSDFDQVIGEQEISQIKSLVEIMVLQWKRNEERVTELHTNLLRSILLILNNYQTNIADKDVVSVGVTLIVRIQNYVHSYICYPQKLTVKELSSYFKMSESGLRKLFKTKMGIPLRNYINSLRLEQIMERIKNSSSTLSEIGQDFGFADSSHLYHFFLNHTGMTPLLFRKQTKS